MDEKRLEVFAAVARRLSFSDAARVLHLSQPAVSQQIATLERELGARLFERTTRRVRLTAAGVALLQRTTPLLRDLGDARRAVAAADGSIGGDLAVAASLTIGGYVLPSALTILTREHPQLKVSVSVENSEQVARSLFEGRADVGFVEGELDLEGLVLRIIRTDELVVVVPARHRFAAVDTEIPLDELLREPLVVREAGSGTRQMTEVHLGSVGVDVGHLRVVAELSSIDAIKSAVRAELGVAIISNSALEQDNRDLVVRRIRGIRLTRQMAAALVPGSPLLPSVRRLLALLEATA